MANLSIPETPNVTMVVFYGPEHTKPVELESLIASLKKRILESEHLTGTFDAYHPKQVHATLLGCEGLKTTRGILSKWFWERRKEERHIDLTGFINYARSSGQLPITVRIGGFDPNENYGFKSRDQHPYERSFQFQKENDVFIPVLMGWPCRGQQFPLDIDRFRLGAQSFNLLHKFHGRVESVDNDFYLRLGVLKGVTSEESLRRIEGELRELLRSWPPTYISIEKESIAFAGYNEVTLDMETTQVVSLSSATKQDVEKLYPRKKS
jgi:hypothetical protein